MFLKIHSHKMNITVLYWLFPLVLLLLSACAPHCVEVIENAPVMKNPVIYGGVRTYKGKIQENQVVATLPKGKYLLKMARSVELPAYYVPVGDKQGYLFLDEHANYCSKKNIKTFDPLVLLSPEAFKPKTKQ